MTAITLTAKKIRPLLKAIVRPYNLGGAASVGQAVYIAADGDIEPSDADAANTARAIGVIVSIGAYGATSGIAGDRVDVCVFGPVVGWGTLTPGNEYFASVTPGEIEDTAPAGASSDFRWIIGRAELVDGEYVLFINPYTDDPAAQ